jgi:hypothetical protein
MMRVKRRGAGEGRMRRMKCNFIIRYTYTLCMERRRPNGVRENTTHRIMEHPN